MIDNCKERKEKKGYKKIIEKNKKRIKIVNADQDIESVVNDCMKVIKKYLYDKKYIKK